MCYGGIWPTLCFLISLMLNVKHVPFLISVKNAFVQSGAVRAGILRPFDSIPSCNKSLFGLILNLFVSEILEFIGPCSLV